MLGSVAMAIMFIEMTIYLAYKKDIIFSFMTLADFVGMYLNNKYYEENPKDPMGYPFESYIFTVLITCFSVSSAFILVTLIHDFDKVFYLKYRIYFNKFEKQKKLLE